VAENDKKVIIDCAVSSAEWMAARCRNPMPILIRTSADADLPAMLAIYARHVLQGVASFELDPPDLDEMTRRRGEVLAQRLPWLVACEQAQSGDAVVAGYAYAGPFRPRPAYRFTVEDLVYVDETRRGRGIGRLLLVELLARCCAAGARQAVAVIGGSEPASIALHRGTGFRPAGTLTAVGWKFDGWRDVCLMQRALGHGHRGAPGAA
jgi:L-amino acid N-acyltransferase YncA